MSDRSEKKKNVLALIAFGSNLDNPERNATRALELLRLTPSVRVVRTSSFYKTFPVGGPKDQPVFLNGCALVETRLTPHELLRELQKIEQELKRVRRVFWGPRTLDLDLILYGDAVLRSEELTLPHPRLQWRNFVLDPASEIAPNMIVPILGWSFEQLRTLFYWNISLFPILCESLKEDAESFQRSESKGRI